MNQLPEILSAKELYEELSHNTNTLVLDVRESWEQELRPFKNALCIPLGMLEERLEEVDHERSIVTLCLSGRRSSSACHLLKQAGFVRVRNLEGGINAWDAFLEAHDIEFTE